MDIPIIMYFLGKELEKRNCISFTRIREIGGINYVT